MSTIINRVICLISIIVSNSHSYKFRGDTSLPEIWLTSFIETDSIEITPAEPEFRTLVNFENEFISKNGSDFVIEEDAVTATFACQSNRFPVMWTIPHMMHVEHTASQTFETYNIQTSDIQNDNLLNGKPPENKYFQSVLTINLLSWGDFLSVNLTCGKPPEEEVFIVPRPTSSSSSIYLFSTRRDLIENRGYSIDVYIPPIYRKDYDVSGSSSQLILPCRPASPAVTILLDHQVDKQENNDTGNTKEKWNRLQYPSQNLKFDPKIGFIMEINAETPTNLIAGLYRCTALAEGVEEADQQETYNSQQFMNVNVISESEQGNMTGISDEEVHFQPVLKLEGGAILSYNNQTFGSRPSTLPQVPINYDRVEIMSCSGIPNRKPEIYDTGCFGYLQCDIIKWSIIYKIRMSTSEYGMYEFKHAVGGADDPSDCVRSYLFSSSVVYCKEDNVQFADQLVSVFNKGLFPVSSRPRKRKEEEDERKYTLYGYETESNARNADVSQKIFLTIGHPAKSSQFDENDARRYSRNFGLDLVEPQMAEHFEYSDVEPVEGLSDIWEYPRDHFYEGEPLIAVCLGWSYLYSHGAQLSINFRNGTRGIVISEKNKGTRRRLHFSGANWGANYYAQQQEIVNSVGKELIAHRDMISIECWMPQWNTEKWDKVTRNLTVFKPVPPKFVGDEEEVVIFYLGEKQDKELKWQFLEGTPEPRITVTNNGKDIFKGHEAGYYWKYFDTHVPDEMFYEESLFNATLEKENSTTAEESSIPTFTTGNLLVKIMFNPEVTYEIQGVYQCVAENVGGIVRKRYRVVVAEKRTVLLPIVLTTTVMLSLVFILILVIKFWRQRNQVESMRNR